MSPLSHYICMKRNHKISKEDHSDRSGVLRFIQTFGSVPMSCVKSLGLTLFNVYGWFNFMQPYTVVFGCFSHVHSARGQVSQP